jgi:hypothetical protein
MKTDQKISAEEIADFRRFLLDSEPCIEQLRESLGTEGLKLDFTPESLQVVDEILKKEIKKRSYQTPIRWDQLADFQHQEQALNPEEIWLIVRIAYYFAEVLHRNLQTEWVFEDRPKRQHFKQAVIKIDDVSDGIEPLELVLRNAQNNQAKGLYYTYQFVEKLKNTK